MLNYFTFNLIKLIKLQSVFKVRLLSIIGVFLFFSILIQTISGIVLSFSLVNDTLLVSFSRSTEDMDNLYIDDFFWLHERGVDYIFTFMYIHLFRKLYLSVSVSHQESAWKSGSFIFLLIHLVIFLGLVLCCTHLSDITLKIASKIISTLTFKLGHFDWWLFTDQTLNTDTLIRVMYLHYIFPFFIIFVSLIHMLDMHYGHKDSTILENKKITYNWLNDIVKYELINMFLISLFFILLFLVLFNDNEPLSYEMFMWGDLGLNTDIRYLSVSPHWYFRAYMGWLIFCPHHYIGVLGLIYYMCVIYFQPNILYMNNSYFLNSSNYFLIEYSYLYNLNYLIFFLSVLYCTSYLPYGRFYTGLEGNFATTFSYLYVFFF